MFKLVSSMKKPAISCLASIFIHRDYQHCRLDTSWDVMCFF
jgi:hypothetical protein